MRFQFLLKVFGERLLSRSAAGNCFKYCGLSRSKTPLSGWHLNFW